MSTHELTAFLAAAADRSVAYEVLLRTPFQCGWIEAHAAYQAAVAAEIAACSAHASSWS